MVNLDQDGAAFRRRSTGRARRSSCRRVDGAVRRSVLGRPPRPAIRRRRHDQPARPDVAPRAWRFELSDDHHRRHVRPDHDGDEAYQQFDDVTTSCSAPAPACTGAATSPPAPGGSLRRLVAGRRLPRPDRAVAQPHRLRRVLRRRLGARRRSRSPGSSPRWRPVDARLGMVAYEGDKGAAGDEAFLNSDSAWPPTCRAGPTSSTAPTTATAPTSRPAAADVNMLGFDIMQLGVPDAIPNGATSATVGARRRALLHRRRHDAINLYAPDFTSSRKAVTNLAAATRRDGRHPGVHAHLHQHGTGPGGHSVAIRPAPAEHDVRARLASRSCPGPTPGPKTDASGTTRRSSLPRPNGARPPGHRRVRCRRAARSRPRDDVGALPGRRRPRAAGDDARQPGPPRLRGGHDRCPFTYVGNDPETPSPPNADLRSPRRPRRTRRWPVPT